MKRMLALISGLAFVAILAAPSPQMWPFPGPGRRTLSAGGITRTYYSASSAGESSRTGAGSSTYADKTSVTFTGDGSDYLVLGSCAGRASTWNVNSGWRLYDDTGAAVIGEMLQPQPDYPSYVGHQWMDIKTVSASQTYSIEYKTNDTAETAYIKQAALAVLKLTSSDKYVESVTRVTTSSTTFQDGATLTFTPASLGDYLIVATGVVDMPTGTIFASMRLDIDGTTQFGEPWQWESGTNGITQSWTTMYKANLSAASHTIKIQYRSQGSAGTIGVQYQRIVALRLDGFEDEDYAVQTTPATTTSTTEQTFLTLTDTAASAKDHLRMWCANQYAVDQATSHAEAFLYENTSLVLDTALDSRHTFYTNYGSSCYFDVAAGAGATNWYIKYSSENGANVGMNDGAIALLQLEP